MSSIKFKATKNDEGRILFKYLIKSLNDVPISKIEKLFRLKEIKVNDKRNNDKSYKIRENDEIVIFGLKDEIKEVKNKNVLINFKKIFEDKNILVIEKLNNVVVHGEDNSLDNQVLCYLKYNKIDSFKPSHIGRLDKATSGIMIYAKNYKTLVELNKKTKYFEKYYELKSDFPWDKKHVVFYSIYDSKQKNAILKTNPPGSKMETIFFKDNDKKYAQILTGKKHQIRLSLAKLNYPIEGDKKYGGINANRLFLHCCKIVFHQLENELSYLNETFFTCYPEWKKHKM